LVGEISEKGYDSFMIKTTNKLFCFSPPVMIATFVIEIILAAYVIVRYKMTPLVRLGTAVLVLLALFQLAEYNVCGHSFGTVNLWSRIGYIAITMLPPLGIHLVYMLAKRKPGVLVWISYALGVAFALLFGLSKSAFVGHVCAGNYNIFQLASPIGGLYFIYYYALLFMGIGLCLYFTIGADKLVKQVLTLQAVGYLSFLLPTIVVNTISVDTLAGVPSIMCGFAVLYAIIIALGIIPMTSKKRS